MCFYNSFAYKGLEGVLTDFTEIIGRYNLGYLFINEGIKQLAGEGNWQHPMESF